MAKNEFVDWFIQQLFSEQETVRKAILEILPQGHGRGFNADLLDALHAEDLIEKASTRGYLLTRKLLGSMVGGAGGGPHTHSINEIILNADLLPETDGAYGVGDDVKRWISASFYNFDPVTEYFASARVSAKLPEDDPDNPDLPAPHVDLSIFPGVGFDSYRIWQNPNDFLFTISRRVAGVGSWEDILKFDTGGVAPKWRYGADLSALVTNAYNLGSDSFRWKQIFAYQYFDIFGFITLPSPSAIIRRKITICTPSSALGDQVVFCRKRAAADYKWCIVSDMHENISILRDVEGIVKTDIGQVAVEILSEAFRSKIDLTSMDQCRVVFGGSVNENVVFYCKIQYSTDGSTWSDLTPEGASNGSQNEQLVTGNWGNVPSAACADVWIRAVGKAASDTADPTYKNIELQVK